jgi:hypothetical protein
MRKRGKHRRLDFEIDKLTSSIENARTGEVFETEIIRMTDGSLIKPKDWRFDWQIEIEDREHEVYGLVTRENALIIHGLVSFSDNNDHLFMHLLESALFNQGKDKQYRGIPANLAAFVCKTSFENGYGGLIMFNAKTNLIEHYEKTLGAKRFRGNRMFINTRDAYNLVIQYFKDFDNARL